MQLFNPYKKSELNVNDFRKVMYWIQDNLGIEPLQYWLIKKL